MKCPYCKEEANGETICKVCREDLSIFYKAEHASNEFYNRGLKKAKVHDLSGAIVELRSSLKLNKRNTNARNLLGLVYYEMGEVVNGLSEWVVSKHFDPVDNPAELYLQDIQASPAKIDNYNQSFKKYNLALDSIKQKNEDLALIHLKKVINLNPHFVRGMQLLALLYINQNENEKAKRILNRAKKVDVTNTTTLLYLDAVTKRETDSEMYNEKDDSGKITPFSFGQMDAYKDDKPNVMAFVNLIVGIVIGICVVSFLVVPTVKENAAKKYNTSVVDSNSMSTADSASARNLQTTNESLQKQLEEKEKQIKKMDTKSEDMKVYDNLFAASKQFLDGDKEKSAESLSKVNVKKFKSEEAKALYSYIKSQVFADAIQQYAQEGRDLCNSGKLDEAITVLQKAYSIADENDSSYDQILYFLGRAYQKKNNKTEAKKYYDLLIQKCPNSSRTSTAKTRLREMGFQ